MVNNSSLLPALVPAGTTTNVTYVTSTLMNSPMPAGTIMNTVYVKDCIFQLPPEGVVGGYMPGTVTYTGNKATFQQIVSFNYPKYTYNYPTYTKYSAKFSLPYTGTWRIRGYHAENSATSANGNAATYSAYKTVKAK